MPDRVGGRHNPGSRRSASYLTSHRRFGAFVWCFRKMSRSARTSLCCAGLLTAVSLSGKLLVSSITLALPAQPRELEDYTVELHGLTTLDLIIVPDIGGGSAHASIA